MTNTRAWPVKVMYMLIAAALAISLIIIAAPTQRVSANPGLSEWTKVSTPSGEGCVLAPNSTIISFAVGTDGEVAYAVWKGALLKDNVPVEGYWLLKSDNHAATWKDLNDALDNVIDPDNEDLNYIDELLQVACSADDPDFVAVALWWWDEGVDDWFLSVLFSVNGGATFKDAGEVEDSGIYLSNVFDLAVSPQAGGKWTIAIGGTANTSYGAGIFRCTVTGDSASAWEDATVYSGWDNRWAGDTDSLDNIYSDFITDIEFSPKWSEDKTVLVTTVYDYDGNWTDYVYGAVYLQSGSWGTSPAWNEKSTLSIEAVPIKENVKLPAWLRWDYARAIAGMTLPNNYNSKTTDKRILWVWVDYYDSGNAARSEIVRVDNDSSEPVGPLGQIEEGKVWLTNVSYNDEIAQGEAIASVLGNGVGGTASCCNGVQVYRNKGIKNMDICCIRWLKACKPPTGSWAMAVSYVGADKAYAVALSDYDSYDEGAWSVSADDGDTWNQISLVDTWIDFLSDVAVSPDCNKMMLVSVNLEHGCSCDSVWLKANNLPEEGYSEYSDQWLRTWCKRLEGDYPYGEHGMLRLAPEETTGADVRTVYLVDRGTGNVYSNDLETLACWELIATTSVSIIVDLAVKDKATLYALDVNGDVSKFDEDEWQEEVDSEVDNGWTIAVNGDDILVGSQDGYVSHSTDGGETFALLKDVDGNDEPTPIEGYVTVAFDSYFDTNDTIYAAVSDCCPTVQGGVYRWVIDKSEEWKDLGANHNYGYTGLVLGRNPGNPMSNKDFGGVLYASYVGETCDGNWSAADDFFNCWKGVKKCWFTGVARCLTPAGEISCEKCIEWDYLTVGLTNGKKEAFYMIPNALKICGCLEPTTTTKLFAIDGIYDTDGPGYDMLKGHDGTVWTFEDCYAKKAPELISHANNTTIPADCFCNNLPFTLNWDDVCDACYYDVQIALDEEFNDVVWQTWWETSSYSIISYPEGGKYMLGATGPSFVVPSILVCGVTYHWRARAHQAETCQIIHSWWSDGGTITIAPSAEQSAITLIAPRPSDTGVATKNVGFSWDLLAVASKYEWVLSTNADLSSPFDSKSLTNKAYTCTKTLSYGTTYYWQVKAYKNGTPLATSAIGVFTTAAQGPFCCPIDGLCFDTVDALKAHTADAHPAPPSPSWVWVVIAIGAVLVIVVIVLIFRTRRV